MKFDMKDVCLHEPYRYRYIDLNNELSEIRFKCPVCGFDDCVNVDGVSHFESFHMCKNCGNTSYKGKEFNYYNDCFYHIKPAVVVQLELF